MPARIIKLLYIGFPDLSPEALDGLLNTIADLALSIRELITAIESATNFESIQGKYMYRGHF